MNLHNQIMNIPIKPIPSGRFDEIPYKIGHRDARHAAAELALKYDELIDDLENHYGKGVISIFKRKNGLGE